MIIRETRTRTSDNKNNKKNNKSNNKNTRIIIKIIRRRIKMSLVPVNNLRITSIEGQKKATREEEYGRPGYLKEKEIESLNKLRSNENESGLNALFLDDGILLRYLRSREFNVERSLLLLQQHREWRNDFPEGRSYQISEFQIPFKFHLDHLVKFGGHDKEGYPIIMLRPRVAYPKDIEDSTEVALFFVAYMDSLCRYCQKVGKYEFVVVCDYSGFSIRNNFSMSLTRLMIAILQEQYPETLYRLLVINTPFGYNTIWNFISPLIEDRVKTKMKILKQQEELLDYINADQLEITYGGNHSIYPVPDIIMSNALEGIGKDAAIFVPVNKANGMLRRISLTKAPTMPKVIQQQQQQSQQSQQQQSQSTISKRISTSTIGTAISTATTSRSARKKKQQQQEQQQQEQQEEEQQQHDDNEQQQQEEEYQDDIAEGEENDEFNEQDINNNNNNNSNNNNNNNESKSKPKSRLKKTMSSTSTSATSHAVDNLRKKSSKAQKQVRKAISKWTASLASTIRNGRGMHIDEDGEEYDDDDGGDGGEGNDEYNDNESNNDDGNNDNNNSDNGSGDDDNDNDNKTQASTYTHRTHGTVKSKKIQTSNTSGSNKQQSSSTKNKSKNNNKNNKKDKKKKRIVVFGASGRLGRLLIRELLLMDFSVTAFLRADSPATTNAALVADISLISKSTQKEKNKFVIVRGDISDVYDLDRTIEGAYMVINAIGIEPSMVKLSEGYVKCIEPIIESCKHQKVKKLIIISSQAVSSTDSWSNFFSNGGIKPVYWLTHWKYVKQMEEMVESSGLSYTIIRPPSSLEGGESGDFSFIKSKCGYKIINQDPNEILSNQFRMNREHLAVFIVQEIIKKSNYDNKTVSVASNFDNVF